MSARESSDGERLTAVVVHDGTVASSSADATVAWWSFTKALLAACILLLSERRRIRLDEPLAGFPFTPRQLLQHRAGVGNYGGLAEYHAAVANGEKPWSVDDLLRRIPPDDLLFAPDTGWAYSNIGYLLLRREVERATDSSLKEALKQLVLRPLGLEIARVAETAGEMQAIAFPATNAYDPGWVYHGCVIGPACEATLALHRLLAGELLSPASRDAMLGRFPIGHELPGRPWVTTGYGLGVMMGLMKDRKSQRSIEVVGHSAGGPGSVAAVYSCSNNGRRRTAGAFAAGNDEGIAEFTVLELLDA